MNKQFKEVRLEMEGSGGCLVMVFLAAIAISATSGIFGAIDSVNEKISESSLCRAIAMDRVNLGVEERVDLYKTCKEKF